MVGCAVTLRAFRAPACYCGAASVVKAGEHYGQHGPWPRCEACADPNAPEALYGLTLRQPWATAVAKLGKRLENRGRGPGARHVGRTIAIHAGAAKDVEGYAELAGAGLYQAGDPFPVRSIVAVARIASVLSDVVVHRSTGSLGFCLAADATDGGGLEDATRPADVARWARGPWIWVLDRVEAIDPIGWKGGALGLWRMPPWLARDVHEARPSVRATRLPGWPLPAPAKP